MKELKSFIVGMILLVILFQFLNGQGAAVVVFVTALLAVIADHLKVLMIAVALPVLFAGGLLYVSPWHRDLAGRLVVGALAVLVVAVLGPPFLHWFQVQVSTFGGRLFGEHVLIGGTMGRGKSGLLNAIMAALSLCPDVVVWGVDMKMGLELLPWLPVLGRLATTNEEALELLTAANRVLDARARLLAARKGRKWRPSAEEPALVIAIDELAELSGKALALFERMARMGRAAGLVLVAVTQRPSLAALGSLDARTQMTIRVSMGVIEARDAELILGSGRLAEGWRTERLGGPGYFLVLAPGQHEMPRQARAYWLSDAAVGAAAASGSATRPALDPASAEAAGEPQKPAEDAANDGPDDPDRLLLAALDEAPPGGLSADELAARLGRGRTWVYKRLMAHSSSGRAVRLRRGRWAAQRGSKPRER